jgi:hypothetical protein
VAIRHEVQTDVVLKGLRRAIDLRWIPVEGAIRI